MQMWQSMFIPAAVLLTASFLIVTEAQGAVNSIPEYNNDVYVDPYEVAEILTRMGDIIRERQQLSSQKRGLDLGVGRGFSASLAAKHLLGMASANYAGGPGRKRRQALSPALSKESSNVMLNGQNAAGRRQNDGPLA